MKLDWMKYERREIGVIGQLDRRNSSDTQELRGRIQSAPTERQVRRRIEIEKERVDCLLLRRLFSKSKVFELGRLERVETLVGFSQVCSRECYYLTVTPNCTLETANQARQAQREDEVISARRNFPLSFSVSGVDKRLRTLGMGIVNLSRFIFTSLHPAGIDRRDHHIIPAT